MTLKEAKLTMKEIERARKVLDRQQEKLQKKCPHDLRIVDGDEYRDIEGCIVCGWEERN